MSADAQHFPQCPSPLFGRLARAGRSLDIRRCVSSHSLSPARLARSAGSRAHSASAAFLFSASVPQIASSSIAPQRAPTVCAFASRMRRSLMVLGPGCAAGAFSAPLNGGAGWTFPRKKGAFMASRDPKEAPVGAKFIYFTRAASQKQLNPLCFTK